MKQIEFETDVSLEQILQNIKEEAEDQLLIKLPSDAVVLKKPYNKKIIEQASVQFGKSITISIPDTTPSAADELEEKTTQEDFVEGKDVAEQVIKNISHQPISTIVKKVGFLAKAKKIAAKRFLKVPLFVWSAAIVLTFIIFPAILLWLIPSATVNILVENKPIETDAVIIASAQVREIDAEGNVIPLKTESITKTGLENAKATGKKTVGDPAKGRITLVDYRFDLKAPVKKGTIVTVLEGPAAGFQFSVDNDVTVPVATKSADLTKTFNGTAGVNVTATKIGEKGNVSAGTKFKVGSYSREFLEAINDVDFSGGNSHEAIVVSGDDQKKLLESLTEKLKNESEEELKAKLGDINIPEGGIETEMIKQTFDKAVGEETKEFSLSLEVKTTAKIFEANDIKEVMKKVLEPSIPEGFVISEEDIEIESEVLEKQSPDSLKILGKIKSVLKPKLDLEKVKHDLARRRFGTGKFYLENLGNVSGSEISVRPGFFKIFGILPPNPDRIEVKTVVKGQ